MQQDGEPSVEEILESIKQVIARDNRDSAALTRQRKEAPPKDIGPVEIEPETALAEANDDSKDGAAAAEIDGDEVLNLGPESAIVESDDDEIGEFEDLEFADDGFEDDELEDDFEDEASSDSDPLDTSTLEGLTTESATEAMRQSLAALSMLSEPSAPPRIVRSGETSLEGLVRDLLRPMLAQWLETNLPEIVDQHVKAEIARIAGKGR